MLTILRINHDLFLDGPCAKNDKRLRSEWQAYRRSLLRLYTLPSLLAQTHGNWRAWIRCDPDLLDLHGPLHDLAAMDPRIRIVYDGDAAARDLATHPGDQYDRILYGRIDSDDMLHPRAIERWIREVEATGCEYVQMGDGYALQPDTGRLWEWNHFSPAVLARVCARAQFAAGLPEQGGNHGKVHEFARRCSDGRWYLVTVHGDNLCNKPNSRWVGREITGPDRERAMREFGLDG